MDEEGEGERIRCWGKRRGEIKNARIFVSELLEIDNTAFKRDYHRMHMYRAVNCLNRK